MGEGELNKHWPSELVSFTELLSQLHSQCNLFTTQAPCNYQLPSRGQASAWGELTLSEEREAEERGRESPIKRLRQGGAQVTNPGGTCMVGAFVCFSADECAACECKGEIVWFLRFDAKGSTLWCPS